MGMDSKLLTMSTRRVPGLWRALSAYGLWAVCFTVLYTLHALGCTGWSAGWPGVAPGLISPVGLAGLLVLVWLGFIAALLAMTWRSGRRLRPRCAPTPFMDRLTFLVDASAVVITLASGLPVVLVPACA